MENKRITLRLKNKTNTMIDMAMEKENELRSAAGNPPLSRNQLIESMLQYAYNHKYNSEMIEEIKNQESNFITDLMNKIMAKYIASIAKFDVEILKQIQTMHQQQLAFYCAVNSLHRFSNDPANNRIESFESNARNYKEIERLTELFLHIKQEVEEEHGR